MNQSRIEAIEKQLRKMEKETRRLKLALLLTAVLPVLVVLAGFQPAGPDQTVEATQLILKDKDKRNVARLFVDEDGLPRLCFYDKGGISRVEAGIFKFEKGFFVLDAAGKANVHLGTSLDRTAQLNLVQAGGKRVSLMSVVGDGKGETVASLSMGGNEEPDELLIENDHEASRITMITKPVAGDDGTVSMNLISDAKGRSEITIFDKQYKVLLGLKGDPSGKASISVLDGRQGKMLAIPNP